MADTKTKKKDDPKPKSLLGKLALAASKMNAVEKGDKNDFHGYSYVTHNQTSDIVRTPLFDVGAFITYDIKEHTTEDGKTSRGKPMRIHTVKFVATFHNTEDANDKISINWIGQGEDTDDKGVGKALSSGIKSLLLKTFLIPAEDPSNDIEHTSNDKRRLKPERNNQKNRSSQGYNNQNQQQQTQNTAPKQPSKKTLRYRYLVKVVEKKFPDFNNDQVNGWIRKFGDKRNLLTVDPQLKRGSIKASSLEQIEALIKAIIEFDPAKAQQPEPEESDPQVSDDELLRKIERFEAHLSQIANPDERDDWLVKQLAKAPSSHVGPLDDKGLPDVQKWTSEHLSFWANYLETQIAAEAKL